MTTPSIPTWEIPLDSPPSIHFANVGCHGGEESWHAYRMHELWCIHWYDYHGRIEIGDWQGEIQPGMISVVPPGQTLVHRWKQKNSRHFFAHFSTGPAGSDLTAIPAFLASAGDGERALMEEAATGSTPGRSRAALWECLWRITQRYAGNQSAHDRDPVLRFKKYIEHHLAEPISLEAVAQAGECSPNHANLLFKKATGRTLCDHWRLRRIETACHLLQNTDMGIKQVASHCGYPDLQQFNKLMRKYAGRPPREIRVQTLAL